MAGGPELAIGCPVFERAWALPRWFDSVFSQSLPERTRFVFVLTPGRDATERIILDRAPDAEVIIDESLPGLGDEGWDADSRHTVLATLRNRLLKAVMGLDADHFLSWDSDILLAPGAVRAMLAVRKELVGGLVDMGAEVAPGFWSWMRLEGNDAFRPEPQPPVPWGIETRGGVPVGVIMGAKLMGRYAYRSCRYSDHPLGEDIAFSIYAERLGIDRFLCPAARGEHLYRRGPFWRALPDADAVLGDSPT